MCGNYGVPEGSTVVATELDEILEHKANVVHILQDHHTQPLDQFHIVVNYSTK